MTASVSGVWPTLLATLSVLDPGAAQVVSPLGVNDGQRILGEVEVGHHLVPFIPCRLRLLLRGAREGREKMLKPLQVFILGLEFIFGFPWGEGREEMLEQCRVDDSPPGQDDREKIPQRGLAAIRVRLAAVMPGLEISG